MAIEVYPATSLSNTELLRPVLESVVRNAATHQIFFDEIEDDLRAVEASQHLESERYYAIAQLSGGAVVGMMGLQVPEDSMRQFAVTKSPIEIINAYVLRSTQKLGVGRALVGHLEDKARSEGRTEVLLNSGPRYALTGWPFWRKMYGEPVGKLEDYYGTGFDAMVWRKSLTEPK